MSLWKSRADVHTVSLNESLPSGWKDWALDHADEAKISSLMLVAGQATTVAAAYCKAADFIQYIESRDGSINLAFSGAHADVVHAIKAAIDDCKFFVALTSVWKTILVKSVHSNVSDILQRNIMFATCMLARRS